MSTKKKRTWSYTLMLAASFAVAGLFWIGTLQLNTFEETKQNETAEAAPPKETAAPDISAPVPSEEALPEETTPNEEPPAEEPKEPEAVFRTADRSYFDDALFIGDSRTVGLSEYGDLGGATVIADSGMSVYKVWKNSFSVNGQSKTLQQVLEEQSFGKIYIMLGINELGYPFESTMVKYEEMVTQIESLQPDAILYLQANLHITKDKSDTSEVYNNGNINRFNDGVNAMTGQNRRFYLDVNELFDDENGCLSKEYTVDNAHVLGKYYADWVNWILEHAIFYE